LGYHTPKERSTENKQHWRWFGIPHTRTIQHKNQLAHHQSNLTISAISGFSEYSDEEDPMDVVEDPFVVFSFLADPVRPGVEDSLFLPFPFATSVALEDDI